MTKVPLSTDDVAMRFFSQVAFLAFPTTVKPRQALQEGYIMNP
jgi:hypothetical protein